jgi:hypothetical protein
LHRKRLIGCGSLKVKFKGSVKETQTMKRDSAFISSNFSEHELINKPSAITCKALSASLGSPRFRSSAECCMHSDTFCQSRKTVNGHEIKKSYMVTSKDVKPKFLGHVEL